MGSQSDTLEHHICPLEWDSRHRRGGSTFEDYLEREETRVSEGVPSATEDYETYHRAMQVRAGVRV